METSSFGEKVASLQANVSSIRGSAIARMVHTCLVETSPLQVVGPRSAIEMADSCNEDLENLKPEETRQGGLKPSTWFLKMRTIGMNSLDYLADAAEDKDFLPAIHHC